MRDRFQAVELQRFPVAAHIGLRVLGFPGLRRAPRQEYFVGFMLETLPDVSYEAISNAYEQVGLSQDLSEVDPKKSTHTHPHSKRNTSILFTCFVGSCVSFLSEPGSTISVTSPELHTLLAASRPLKIRLALDRPARECEERDSSFFLMHNDRRPVEASSYFQLFPGYFGGTLH